MLNPESGICYTKSIRYLFFKNKDSCPSFAGNFAENLLGFFQRSRALRPRSHRGHLSIFLAETCGRHPGAVRTSLGTAHFGTPIGPIGTLQTMAIPSKKMEKVGVSGIFHCHVCFSKATWRGKVWKSWNWKIPGSRGVSIKVKHLR